MEDTNPLKETVRLIGGPVDGQTVQIDPATLEITIPVIDPTTWSCTDIIYARETVDGESVFICEGVKRWGLTSVSPEPYRGED
jgi:hypothetical protein